MIFCFDRPCSSLHSGSQNCAGSPKARGISGISGRDTETFRVLLQALSGTKSLDALCKLVGQTALGGVCNAIKKIESQVVKAFKTAAQMESIQTIKRTVADLQRLGNDLKAIQAGAQECSRMPPELRPEAFSGWATVRNEAEFEREYARYKASAVVAQAKVTQCQVVLKKIQQLKGI